MVWNAESGGFREHVSHGDVDAPTGGSTFGVSWRLKSIVKHRIWWVGLNRPFAAANAGDTAFLSNYFDHLFDNRHSAIRSMTSSDLGQFVVILDLSILLIQDYERISRLE